MDKETDEIQWMSFHGWSPCFGTVSLVRERAFGLHKSTPIIPKGLLLADPIQHEVTVEKRPVKQKLETLFVFRFPEHAQNTMTG